MIPYDVCAFFLNNCRKWSHYRIRKMAGFSSETEILRTSWLGPSNGMDVEKVNWAAMARTSTYKFLFQFEKVWINNSNFFKVMRNNISINL